MLRVITGQIGRHISILSHVYACVHVCGVCVYMNVCGCAYEGPRLTLPPSFSTVFTQARSQSSIQFDGQLASESPPVSGPCLGLQTGLHGTAEFARVLGTQTMMLTLVCDQHFSNDMSLAPERPTVVCFLVPPGPVQPVQVILPDENHPPH